MGLTCLWEDHRMYGGRKARTLVIAGRALQLDIILDNNIVLDVSLSFPLSAPIVIRHVEKAGQILLRDLQLLPNQSPLTRTLDRFAANLERLADLDSLSIIPGLDCHEALAGLYVSLERLHKWDVTKLREDPTMSAKSEKFLVTTAMCTRHGYPVMHTRDRVGLCLEYWTERRQVEATTPLTTSYCATMAKVWSIIVGCAPLGGLIYTPIRISENWISESIQKTDFAADDVLAASGGVVLDWLQPDTTVLPTLPQSDLKDSVGIVVQPDPTLPPKLPDAMFTATFDPPVIVPQSVWVELHGLTGAEPPTLYSYPPTFDSLFFPIVQGTDSDPSEPRNITRERSVYFVSRDGEQSYRQHTNTLFIYKPVYGQKLTELPFSHPQQLVSMLPKLRQYALISTLLQRSFGENPDLGKAATAGASANRNTTTTTKNELDGFMVHSAAANSEPRQSLSMDVTLSVHPVPRLQIVFPFRKETANIILEIRLNGAIHVVSQNIIPDEENGVTEVGKGKGKQFTVEQLGLLLEHMEDLCQWCEWVRSRLE
jgi:hypothetical protein